MSSAHVTIRQSADRLKVTPHDVRVRRGTAVDLENHTEETVYVTMPDGVTSETAHAIEPRDTWSFAAAQAGEYRYHIERGPVVEGDPTIIIK